MILTISNIKDKMIKIFTKQNKKRNDVVIISCGPSLSKLDPAKVRKFCQGKKVICIKQAWKYVKYKDYVIHNNIRYDKSYKCRGEKVYSVVWKGDNDERLIREASDKVFTTIKGFKNVRHLAQKDPGLFWRANIKLKETGIVRGPGVMIELAFPIALSLSPKRIYTFGWDIFSYSDSYEHFYKDSSITNNDTQEAFDVSNFYLNKLYDLGKIRSKSIYVISDLNKLDAKPVKQIGIEAFV